MPAMKKKLQLKAQEIKELKSAYRRKKVERKRKGMFWLLRFRSTRRQITFPTALDLRMLPVGNAWSPSSACCSIPARSGLSVANGAIKKRRRRGNFHLDTRLWSWIFQPSTFNLQHLQPLNFYEFLQVVHRPQLTSMNKKLIKILATIINPQSPLACNWRWK